MFPTWHHLRLSLMITLTTAWAWRSDENYASGHLAMVMVRVCSSPSHCQSSFLPPAPSLSPSCPVLASQSVTPSIPHFHFFLLNFPSNNFRSLATHPLQDLSAILIQNPVSPWYHLYPSFVQRLRPSFIRLLLDFDPPPPNHCILSWLQRGLWSLILVQFWRRNWVMLQDSTRQESRAVVSVMRSRKRQKQVQNLVLNDALALHTWQFESLNLCWHC